MIIIVMSIIIYIIFIMFSIFFFIFLSIPTKFLIFLSFFFFLVTSSMIMLIKIIFSIILTLDVIIFISILWFLFCIVILFRHEFSTLAWRNNFLRFALLLFILFDFLPTILWILILFCERISFLINRLFFMLIF